MKKTLLWVAAMALWATSAIANGVNNKIEVVVHRGANHIAPENTVESAFAALDNGADWMELDVRMSKDSVFYNLHDGRLDRTTNGEGWIDHWLSEDIDTLDAGIWFSARFAGAKVPTITHMLDTLKGKCNFFFDVKPGTPIKRFVRMLREKGINPDNSFFWFADTCMLKEFVVEAPEMKIKVNASDVARIEFWKRMCRPSYIEIHVDVITPELKRYCRENGIKIMAAIQEASEDEYLRAIELKPDLVNLDMPELFARLLRAKK